MMGKAEQKSAGQYRGLAFASALIAAGLGLVYHTLFIYKGGFLDPPVLGRYIVVAGVLYLGVNLIYILGIKKWYFLFLVLLLVGVDMGVDYWARNLKHDITARRLEEKSAIADAVVTGVIKPVLRKGRVRQYPHIVCEYVVEGKAYRQMYWIDKDAPFVKGTRTSVRYYPGDPRISVLADEGLPAVQK